MLCYCLEAHVGWLFGCAWFWNGARTTGTEIITIFCEKFCVKPKAEVYGEYHFFVYVDIIIYCMLKHPRYCCTLIVNNVKYTESKISFRSSELNSNGNRINYNVKRFRFGKARKHSALYGIVPMTSRRNFIVYIYLLYYTDANLAQCKL